MCQIRNTHKKPSLISPDVSFPASIPRLVISFVQKSTQVQQHKHVKQRPRQRDLSTFLLAEFERKGVTTVTVPRSKTKAFNGNADMTYGNLLIKHRHSFFSL